MDIELTDHDDPALRMIVASTLRRHTEAALGISAGWQEMAVLFRGANGDVEGGLCAAVRFGWLSLELAYVPTHLRGRGVGRAALGTLERAAQALGCHGVRTSTLSIQAPGFYERLGYRAFGRLEFQPGVFDIALYKRLEPALDRVDEADVEMASEADKAFILETLRACNDRVLGPSRPQPLSFALRDASGQVQGGLIGSIERDWLHIELFVLPESARRSGLGSKVLTMAHDAARARGAIGAMLTTGSFQAPGFYEKHGYAAYGRLPDFLPGGHTRFLMARRFDR